MLGKHIEMTEHKIYLEENTKILHQTNRSKNITLLEQLEIEKFLEN